MNKDNKWETVLVRVFFEASSCDGINVNEVFIQLMREIRKLQAPEDKKSKKKRDRCTIL